MTALPASFYDLDTPALIVDLDRLERNIARMAELTRNAGIALRPHTKTHKCAEIAAMQIAAGATGLTVAKLGEAEALADLGFTDLFMANEVIGPNKIERLIALLRRARLVVGVDSTEGAAALTEAGTRAGLRIPVRVEIDTGLGRAGVRSVDEAVRLAQSVDRSEGLELDGIFTHEGVSYNADAGARASACTAAAGKMREISARLRSSGVHVRQVSMGSTPGAALIAEEVGITELRPGNYVFLDRMQVGFGADPEDCALSVLTTVVSRPEEHIAIIDAGVKSLASDRAASGSIHGAVTEDAGIVFERASEEHGILNLRGATVRPKIGDKLRVVPIHACTSVNMHDRMFAVRGERVEACWPVASRGRVQ